MDPRVEILCSVGSLLFAGESRNTRQSSQVTSLLRFLTLLWNKPASKLTHLFFVSSFFTTQLATFTEDLGENEKFFFALKNTYIAIGNDYGVDGDIFGVCLNDRLFNFHSKVPTVPL